MRKNVDANRSMQNTINGETGAKISGGCFHCYAIRCRCDASSCQKKGEVQHRTETGFFCKIRGDIWWEGGFKDNISLRQHVTLRDGGDPIIIAAIYRTRKRGATATVANTPRTLTTPAHTALVCIGLTDACKPKRHVMSNPGKLTCRRKQCGIVLHQTSKSVMPQRTYNARW